MEVLLTVIIALLGLFSLSIYNRNSKLTKAGDDLQTVLNHALEDQRLSEQELQLTNSKLQVLKESSLTPDNAVTKSVYEAQMLEKALKIGDLQSSLTDMTEKFETIRGKAISERVRLGMIGENFVSFHEDFKYNRKETKALFQPIDLICFEEDEVVFLEVKTGGSKLSSKQKRIKQNITEGRVRFEVLRLDDKGIHWES